jgi:aspartate kinase
METTIVSGIVWDENLARISLEGVEHKPDKLYNLFKVLKKHDISVDMLLQYIGRHNTRNISFTVSKDEVKNVIDSIEKNKKCIQYESINKDEQIAKLSIVCDGISTDTSLMFLIFEALFEEDINIQMTSTCQIKMSMIISQKDLDQAAKAIHEKLIKHNYKK